MYFKIPVEFHSYFTVFAKMTRKKKAKALSCVPYSLCSSECMGHIHFTCSLSVQSNYKSKQCKHI